MLNKLFLIFPNYIIEIVRNFLTFIKDSIDYLSYQYCPVIPPPHIIKFNILLSLRKHHNLQVLIETGTFQGEMVRKCGRYFREIYSIELDEQLVKKATERFGNSKNINIIQGNSAYRLSEILKSIKEPVLFWLDAHYSGGITAKAESETPIIEELRAIKGHGIKDNVILIDDVRCFGQGDFPEINEVEKELYSINSNFKITVSNDILRCEPSY